MKYVIDITTLLITCISNSGGTSGSSSSHSSSSSDRDRDRHRDRDRDRDRYYDCMFSFVR